MPVKTFELSFSYVKFEECRFVAEGFYDNGVPYFSIYGIDSEDGRRHIEPLCDVILHVGCVIEKPEDILCEELQGKGIIMGNRESILERGVVRISVCETDWSAFKEYLEHSDSPKKMNKFLKGLIK